MEREKNDYKKGFFPFAVAAGVLSLCGGLTAAVPSNVVADWKLPETMVTWLAMGYSLGAASLAPIMGKLSDILGRRTTILLGLGLFSVGPLLAGFCPEENFILLIVLRFLSGVGAAGVAPVVMAYIMTEYPPEKLGQGFTAYMTISCVAVIFGPAAGGVLINNFGWRSVLFLCAVFSALAWTLCFLLVKRNENVQRGSLKFDYGGAVLVVVLFSMLLAIPTLGQNEGWLAGATLLCVLVGLFALALLVVVEKRAQNPILNGRFMRRRRFILPVLVLFLSQGLLQSCMTNIITFAIVTTGDRTLSGIATSVMYVGMALGTIVIGPLSDKKEPRVVAAAALVFVAAGAALQMLFTETTGLLLMCAAMFLIGLGLGGNTTIFLKIVLSGLDPQTAGSGSGTYNVFRDMAAPFGVAVFVPLFSGGIVTETQRLVATGVAGERAKVQAAVTALHDTAILQVICVLAAIVVCLMLPKIYRKNID